MKKDITELKVEDLAIAILPRENIPVTEEEDLWDVFLINLKEESIFDVLINSRGYGEIDGEPRKTSNLRHFFESIGPRKAVQIEPIPTSLFRLANEYWVSFNFNGYMYDKPYIFVEGSIDQLNFTNIPIINRMGVMIK
jgi:hypothetical protein